MQILRHGNVSPEVPPLGEVPYLGFAQVQEAQQTKNWELYKVINPARGHSLDERTEMTAWPRGSRSCRRGLKDFETHQELHVEGG